MLLPEYAEIKISQQPHLGKHAFVARWCIGYKVETAGGALRVREDEPAPRVGAGLHRTP